MEASTDKMRGGTRTLNEAHGRLDEALNVGMLYTMGRIHVSLTNMLAGLRNHVRRRGNNG